MHSFAIVGGVIVFVVTAVAWAIRPRAVGSVYRHVIAVSTLTIMVFCATAFTILEFVDTSDGTPTWMECAAVALIVVLLSTFAGFVAQTRTLSTDTGRADDTTPEDEDEARKRQTTHVPAQSDDSISGA
jgi:hypothetical protein